VKGLMLKLTNMTMASQLLFLCTIMFCHSIILMFKYSLDRYLNNKNHKWLKLFSIESKLACHKVTKKYALLQVL